MLLSVLTAVHQPGAGFLEETWASIDAQVLPTGWSLEWVLQEDGPPSSIGERVSDPRVRYEANGAKLGIAATRNLGLNRSNGRLIQVLDADDLLLPDALSTLIPVFNDPEIHWALGQADDLLPDGSRKSFPPYPDLPFGRIKAGAVGDWAQAHQGNWPLHCAGLMFRASSVRAIGGWAGVPTNDDLVMLAGLSGAGDGYFAETLTWLYRQHPNQTVRSEHHQTWGEDGARMALQRALAVRVAGLRLPPAVDEQDTVNVQVGPSIKPKVQIQPSPLD